MNTSENVSAIMTTKVITVDVRDDLRTIKAIFKKKGIRHMPVLDGKILIGIVSKNDIMRLSFGNVFEDQEDADDAVLDMLTIDQIMTHRPKSIAPNTSVRDAAHIFVHEDFHSLPVVDNGTIVGIITSTDIIKYLLGNE